MIVFKEVILYEITGFDDEFQELGIGYIKHRHDIKPNVFRIMLTRKITERAWRKWNPKETFPARVYNSSSEMLCDSFCGSLGAVIIPIKERQKNGIIGAFKLLG